MAEKTLLRISALSSKSGVTPRTIRFYVQEGLLPQPIKSRKTLALYNEDCINKVKAIKKAQSEQFLPLVVIRRILEANNFNYSALSDSKPIKEVAFFQPNIELLAVGTERVNLKKVCEEQKISTNLINEIKRLKWIKPEQVEDQETIAPFEYDFLIQLAKLLQNGIEFKDALGLFKSIRRIIEKGVDVELKSAIGWMMKNPIAEIDDVLALEENASRSFINLIRVSRIKNIIQEYKITADNAYRASADEGFALSEEEIIDHIKDLEKNLNKKIPDIRALSDIALGYSCIGFLNQSFKYLRKVLKIDPNNTDAQVRLIWYRRFAKRKSELAKLRNKLEDLTKKNPDYALGHAFLAAWYAIEISEIDNHNEILRKINLCLHELELAGRETPRDLHEWVIIQYAKGRIPFWVPISTDHNMKNIKAFQEIVKQKNEINDYYARRMPFFPKWLWPNVYYFYGVSLIEIGEFKAAEKILLNGRNFNAISPYHMRLEEAILRAKRSKQNIKC
jgi:DNA-binding transcriptional MerR regulator